MTGRRGFDHVETWVFDLDNTLYPSSCRLFDQIDERMGSFISDRLNVDRVEAKRIQKQFFYEHGTTLRGLPSRLIRGGRSFWSQLMRPAPVRRCPWRSAHRTEKP